MGGGAWWAAVRGVTKSQTRLSDFTFTFHVHALEKEMATHSSVLAWRIPGTGEPSGLPSMGLHRVRHDWSDLAAAGVFTNHITFKLPHCKKKIKACGELQWNNSNTVMWLMHTVYHVPDTPLKTWRALTPLMFLTTCEVSITIPILQMKTLRPREMMSLAYNYTPSHGWILCPDCLPILWPGNGRGEDMCCAWVTQPYGSWILVFWIQGCAFLSMLQLPGTKP